MRPLINARWSRTLTPISFVVTLILLVWFVGHYGVNVPHLDDWRMVDFIALAKHHALGVRDFYEQFNEHRILLPRMLFAATVTVGDWNLKLLMYCSVAIAALTCLLLLRLSTIGGPPAESPRASACFKLVICVLVFSWAQFENWLWGFQVAWLLVNLGVVGAVLLLSSDSPRLPFRVALAALCCLASSFSMAHGLFSWIAVLPLLLLLKTDPWKKATVILAWLLMASATWLIYMKGYVRPHGWSYDATLLRQAKHLLMLLGGPFFVGRVVIISYMAGIVVLVASAASWLYFVSRWSRESSSRIAPRIAARIAAWISLSLFTVLFAAVNTIGRTNFGERTATASRYATCMILLYISLAQLWRLFRGETFLPKVIVRAGDAVLVTFIVTFVVVSTHQVVRAQELLLRGTTDRACVEVSDQFDHRIDRHGDRCFQSFGPGEGQEFWNQVSKARTLLGIRNATQFDDGAVMPGEVHVDRAGEEVTVYGSVASFGVADPPVFLSDGERGLIGSAQPEFNWGLAAILGWKRPEKQKWRARVSDGETIRAWAYDRKRRLLVPIR